MHQNYAAFIALAVLALLEVATWFVFRGIVKRLILLKETGAEASATVTADKPYRVKGGKFLEVKYQFQSGMGDTCMGKYNPRWSAEAEEKFKPGAKVTVLYMPEKPGVAEVKDGLDKRILDMVRLTRIFPALVGFPFFFLAVFLMMNLH